MIRKIIGVGALCLVAVTALGVRAESLDEMNTKLQSLVNQYDALGAQIKTLKSDIEKEKKAISAQPTLVITSEEGENVKTLDYAGADANKIDKFEATFNLSSNKGVTLTSFPVTINKFGGNNLTISKVELYSNTTIVSSVEFTPAQNTSFMKFDMPLGNKIHYISNNSYTLAVYFSGEAKTENKLRVSVSNAENYKRMTAVTADGKTVNASKVAYRDFVVKNRQVVKTPFVKVIVEAKEVPDAKGVITPGYRMLTVSRGGSQRNAEVSYWNMSFECPTGLTIETGKGKNLCGSVVKFQNLYSAKLHGNDLILAAGFVAKNSKTVSGGEASALSGAVVLKAYNKNNVELGSDRQTFTVTPLAAKTPVLKSVTDRGVVVAGVVGGEMDLYGQNFEKGMAIVFKSSDGVLSRAEARVMSSMKATVVVPESVRSGVVGISAINVGGENGNLLNVKISPKIGTWIQGGTSGVYPEFTIVNRSITKEPNNSQGNASVYNAVADFSIKIKAVGGDVTFSGMNNLNGVASFGFGAYFNNVLTILDVASTTAFREYPLTSDLVVSNNSSLFTIKKDKEVVLPVTFILEGIKVNGERLPTGVVSVGLQGVSWSSDGGQTWKVTDTMAGKTEWRTASVTLAQEKRSNMMAAVVETISSVGEALAELLGF